MNILSGAKIKAMQLNTFFVKSEYSVFDNDLQKVGAYCSDQHAPLELNKGGKISLILVHFEN
jgi:hypothetical protein